MAVDTVDHLPAVGLEALDRVIGKPAGHLTIDGYVVVVVERNELAEPERPGQ